MDIDWSKSKSPFLQGKFREFISVSSYARWKSSSPFPDSNTTHFFNTPHYMKHLRSTNGARQVTHQNLKFKFCHNWFTNMAFQTTTYFLLWKTNDDISKTKWGLKKILDALTFISQIISTSHTGLEQHACLNSKIILRFWGLFELLKYEHYVYVHSKYVTHSVKTQLKSFFLWFAVFCKKNHPSYGKEHSVKMLPLYILTE